MSKTIVIEGWQIGLEKVSLTMIQKDMLGISLKESKENVDKILLSQIVSFKIDNDNLAIAFVEAAEKIGAICKIANNE